MESEDEVEPYDGTYACGFCSESVRGTAALQCSQCSANPVHWACVAGTKYAGQCATCGGETTAAHCTQLLTGCTCSTDASRLSNICC